ncbi:MAG: universal stress protein [Sandaracinus sp.]
MARTILCGTDFSPAGTRVVEHAALWAEKLGAALEIVHVVTPIISMIPERSFLSELHETIRDDAEGRLDAIVEGLGSRVRVTGHLAEGHADREILERAKQVGADLVALGAHGARGAADAILGGTVDRIVRTSAISVLVVPSNAPVALPRAIVVPTDLGAPSQHALAWARDLAAPFAATVDVVTGYSLPALADASSPEARDRSRTLRAKLHEVHPGLADERVHAIEAEPATAIERLVLRLDAHLVVMAGGGRSLGSRLLLGSVTDRVLRTLAVPTLVVREAAA